jgi:hypothetical protein
MARHLKFRLYGAGIDRRLVARAIDEKTPYWASIDETEGTGPNTEFPVKWVYKRQFLPVRRSLRAVWRQVGMMAIKAAFGYS